MHDSPMNTQAEGREETALGMPSEHDDAFTSNHDASSSSGSAVAPVSTLPKSRFSLLYADPAVEAQFIDHLNRTPTYATFVCETSLMTGLIGSLFVLEGDEFMTLGITLLVTTLVSYVLEIILAVMQFVAFKPITVINRVRDFNFGFYVVFLGTSVTFIDRWQISNGCTQGFVIDTTTSLNSYRNACEKSFIGNAVIIMSIATIFSRVRFVWCTAYAALMLVACMVAWIPFGTNNFVETVPLYGIYLCFAFVCLLSVRFIAEQHQRYHFEGIQELANAAAQLEQDERELWSHYCSMLPPALLSKADRIGKNGPLDTGDLVDVCDAVCVAQIDVCDYLKIATKVTPRELASAIGQLHSAASRFALETRMERVLTAGDTFLAVGNLIDPLKEPWTAAVVFGERVATGAMNLKLDDNTVVKPRVAVHIGRAEGVFVGTMRVRYDVRGPAIDFVRRMQLLGEGGRVLVSQSIRNSLEAGFKFVAAGSVPRQVQDPWNPTSTTAKVDGSEWDPLVDIESGTENVFFATSSSATSRLLQWSMTVVPSYEQGRNLNPLMQPAGLPDAARWPSRASASSAPSQVSKKEFYQCRHTGYVTSISRVWMLFAAFAGVHIPLVVADYSTDINQLWAVVLTIGVILSLAAAAVSPRLNITEKTRDYALWLVLIFVAPLTVVYGVALSRPAAPGNDIRGLLMVGAMTQCFSLIHATHAFIVIPLFIIAGMASYALNESAVHFSVVFMWITLGYALYMEWQREKDDWHSFVIHKDLENTLEALKMQKQFRTGLLNATLPPSVMQKLNSMESLPHLHRRSGEETLVFPVQDTVVLVVKAGQRQGNGSESNSFPSALSGNSGGGATHPTPYLTEVTNGGSMTGSSSGVSFGDAGLSDEILHNVLEDLGGNLEVVMMFGDTVVFASPLVDSNPKALDPDLNSALHVATTLNEKLGAQAVLDVDSTLQLLRVAQLPTFTLIGAAQARTRALSDAAPGSGVYATERFVSLAKNATDDPLSSSSNFKCSKTLSWNIRGVGVIRVVSIRREHRRKRSNSPSNNSTLHTNDLSTCSDSAPICPDV